MLKSDPTSSAGSLMNVLLRMPLYVGRRMENSVYNLFSVNYTDEIHNCCKQPRRYL